MALASLICQTYKNWECLFIDDGSDDGSAEVVENLKDPRFRIIRLQKNMGRGAARQRGNEEFKGEYVSMLDVDDWYYTTKLEKQIKYLIANPDISFVSCGMIIENSSGEAVSYRCCNPINNDFIKTWQNPPIAFAPSCIRAHIAKKYSFNPSYKVAEDKDYLRKVCLHESFNNLTDILFVYAEYNSYSINKMYQSSMTSTSSLLSLSKRFSITSTWEIIKVWSKFVIYSIAYIAKLESKLLSIRSLPVTEEIINTYKKDKEIVKAVACKISNQ